MIDHENMILGDFVDHHEYIDIEYKEFCFKTNLFDLFTRHELKCFITNGKILENFNTLIINNIKRYIDVYVPRYMSAFHNSNHSNNHQFYIGINDHCEITGIPFKGNLKIYNYYFINYINEVIQKNVYDSCCIKLNINIIDTIIDNDVLCGDYLDNILKDYEKKRQIYEKDYKDYCKRKKDWISKMYFFKGKLQDVINNESTKLEFVEFLERKSLLESFPEVFLKYHYIISEDVKYVKNNPTTLIYWLIKYKDEKVKHLMTLKPVEPAIPKILNIDYCILTQLSSLRKKLVEQNMKYFVILMTFTCNKDCHHKITYKDPRTKEFRTLTRVIDLTKQSPTCKDIE